MLRITVKSLVGFIFAILLLTLFTFALPNNISAQGYLYCIGDSLDCNIDLGRDPDPPSCSTGYDVPAHDPGFTDACDEQRKLGECKDVLCERSGPPLCAANQSCTGQNQANCSAPGDEFRSCTIASNGAIGSCCKANTAPPPPNGCPANNYCWNWGEAACEYEGGDYDETETKPCASLKDGKTAYCCIPGTPQKCDDKSYCTTVGGGNAQATCQNNQGVPGPCLRHDNGEVGNCCYPAADVYQCELSGRLCVPNLSSVGSACGANWGHCSAGDDSCVSCDELTEDDCHSTLLRCVEQNKTTGYQCQNSFDGCFPCFEWNSDPDSSQYIPACDPPSYRSSSPAGNYGRCKQACSGQIPVTYRCDVKYGCIQDDQGVYNGMQECGIECGAPELFCDLDGKPTSIPNLEWLRFYTTLGCIPIRDRLDAARLAAISANAIDPIDVARGFGADNNSFAQKILELSVGLAGGLALFLIIIGSMYVITSAGDPQKAQAGREIITSAVAGLLLLIFGVFILRIIGVSILGIPGL